MRRLLTTTVCALLGLSTSLAFLDRVVAGRNEPSGDIRASSGTGGGGTGGGTVTYPLAGSADSAAAPDYAWSASPSTGLFSPGANLCAASSNGVEIMRWGSSGAQVAAGKQLLCSAGTAAAPCLTFSANADRGFFSDTTNNGVGIAVGGAQLGYFNASGLVLSSGKVLTPSGTAAAPTQSFSAATGTGNFYDATNTGLGVSVGGTQTAYFSATALALTTGRLLIPSGTAAAPSQAFSASTGTGNFYDSTNTGLGVAVGGAQTAYFASGGLTLTAGRLLTPSGTAAAPSQAFASATGTGTYYDSANTAMGLSAGGAEVAYASAAGLRVLTGNAQSPNGTAAAPGWSFGGSPGTGLYADGTYGLAMAVNGARGWYHTPAAELVMDLSPTGGNNRLRFGPSTSAGVTIFRNGTGVVQFGLADDSGNAMLRSYKTQTTNLDGTTQFGTAVASDAAGLKLYFDTSQSAANDYAVVVQQRVFSQQKTAAYTVTKADTGKCITNVGATAQTVMTLPPATGVGTFSATADVVYLCFTNTVSFGMQLKAQGSDVIQFPGAASTAGGTQTTTTVGGSVRIYPCDTAKWCVEGAAGGTWTGA